MKDLLSNKITRKFTDTVYVNGRESVNTPQGFKPIRCIHKTIPYLMFKIKTKNGFVLRCADNHILIDSKGEEVFAKDCLNKKIATIHGISKVISCKNLKYEQAMYDLELYDGHLYYSNGILSHNTTTTAAAIVHYAIFNQDKSVAILANKDSTAREILSRIKMIIENLPFWLQPGVREWNKKSIEFDNNCRIMTSSTSSSAIRGFSINFLYVDEAAFVPTNIWNDFFTSVYPTISSSKKSKIILTSTPYGMNFFYKLWKESVDGVNGYKNFAVEWDEVPGRDDEWKEKTIKEIGIDRWKQEFEAQFMGSSNTLVDSNILKELVFENPLEQYSSETLRIYELPEENHTYVLSADVAEGVGIDSSTFHIIDITDKDDMRIVCTFENPFEKPNVYHIRLAGYGAQYNNAFIIVENNSYGREVAQNLHYDSEYENLVWDDDFGLKTTKKTKRLGCSHLKFLIEQKILTLTDFDTLQQLSTFIKQNNGSFAAEKTEHDDLIAPLWLFAYFINNNELTERFFDNNDLGKIIYKENIEEMNQTLMPFGFINDGVNSFHDEE